MVLTTSYQKIGSGPIKDYNGAKGHIELWAKYNSQNIENNKSNVTVQLRLVVTNGYIGNYQATYWSISGDLSGDGNIGSGSHYSKTLGTVTGDITHNNDGTKNVTFNGSFNPTYWGSSFILNVTGTADLPTIPRASSITVNDANIGSGTTININRASKDFTTTVYYKVVGENSWREPAIITKWNEGSYGWIVPTSLYAEIPDSPTIKCLFKANTYSGNTLIGSYETPNPTTFTATGNPVIDSCTLESIDSTTINLVGSIRMIRYISTVQATVNASGQNGASIRSIVVNGVTANSSGIATFPNADTYSYDVTVTDSRGYSTTGNYQITWTNYIPLTINATIIRNQPTDGIIKISYNGNYYNGSFRVWNDTYTANTLTVQYRYKEKGGSFGNWTNLTPTTSGNSYSQSNYQISGFDYTKQYEFEIRAIDKVNTVQIIGITVSKGEPVLYWRNEIAGVNGKFYVNGKQAIGGYNLDLSSLSTSNFYPVTFNCKSDILDCEIHSQSDSGSAAYNQNVIHYRQMAAGWSDTPQTIDILTYKNYDNNEITIGCIGYGGASAYEHVVWLRGGIEYNIYSNFEPILHTTDYTSGYGSTESTFTVGTNYYGGSNTNVSLQFIPQNTISSGCYINDSFKGDGSLTAGSGYLYSVCNGVTTQIGAQNSSLTHYTTTANSGHWFNKSVRVRGDVYAGPNYDKLLAYQDQLSTVTTNANGTVIKFPSIKYQICMVKKTFTLSSSTTQIGTSENVYYKTEAWTFPAEFSSEPFVIPTSLDRATGVYGSTAETATTTSVNITCYGPAANRETGYYAIAIGPYS